MSENKKLVSISALQLVSFFNEEVRVW